MIQIPKGNKSANKNSHFGELMPPGSGENKNALEKLMPLYVVSEKYPSFNPQKATVEDFKERITMYFNYCIESDLRPGMESMALFLNTSMRTVLRWAKGETRTELQPIIGKARQVIAAYMEYIMLNGKVFPATGIFLLKNWFGYKDQTTTEIEVKQQRFGEDLTNEQIEAMIDTEAEEID